MIEDSMQVGGDHYLTMAVQPWAAMEAWMTREQFAGFLLGNCIKYLACHGRKGDGLEDLRKAQHYLSKLIAVSDPQQPARQPPPQQIKVCQTCRRNHLRYYGKACAGCDAETLSMWTPCEVTK